MNLITSYIDLEKNIILDYVLTILNQKCTDLENDILNQLLDTYINTYYYHELQTLNKTEIANYNMKIVLKELEGKKIEIVYLNIKDDNKEEITKIVDKVYRALFAAVILDNIQKEDLTVIKLDQALKYYAHLGLNQEKLAKLIDLALKNYDKKSNLDNKLNFETLNLKYSLYKGTFNKYLVTLSVNISELNKYPIISIDKNLNSDPLAIKRTETMFNLINIEIFKKIKESEEIDLYFIEIPKIVLENKEELTRLLSIIDNEFIKKHLVLLLDDDSYKGNKRITNQISSNFKMAILLDISRVREIEEKLDDITEIESFDYIIIDKVKSKDFPILNDYIKESTKEIFTNEFEKE